MWCSCSVGADIGAFPLFQRMAADEIQQREKKDPDNIDEMPIQTKVIDGGGMPIGIGAMVSLVKQDEQNTDADDHVQGVHAGHGKVQEEEELGMLRHIRSQRDISFVGWMDKVFDAKACPGDVVLGVFVVVLDRLDAQEDQS